MSASYALTLAGGIVTAVVGVLALLLGGLLLGSLIPFSMLIGPFIVAFGLWGLAAGAIIIYSASKFKKEKKTYALVAVIFSILALATLQGMLVGPLLSLIGSAMAYGEGKKK